MRYVTILLAFSVAVAATPPASARTAEGPVRLGQIANVGGLHVTPLQVVEDSRCPMNARCVWAGRIVLRARVTGGRWSRSMNLTIGQPARVADGMLTLATVTPDRIAGNQPDRRRARFGFEFEFEFQGGL